MLFIFENICYPSWNIENFSLFSFYIYACNVYLDRKSTRLNSSHGYISYAVFCLKKKKKEETTGTKVRHTCVFVSVPSVTTLSAPCVAPMQPMSLLFLMSADACIFFFFF